MEKIEIYIAVFRGTAALNFTLHADFHIFGNVAGAEGEVVILGGDDLVFREILRRVFVEEMLVSAIGQLGKCLPQLGTQQVDLGQSKSQTDLDKLHVCDPGVGTGAHGVSIAADIVRIHVSGENGAGSAGRQYHGFGQDAAERISVDGKGSAADTVPD